MEKLSALFCFLLLLFITESESRKDPPKCSSSCGDSLVISYPFRLKDDPVTCGDPDFQLYCQNKKTIMNFHGGLYYVKRISYDDQTIHLADLNLANGSCSLPYRSLTMGEITNDARYSGSFNYSYSYTLNYVRCPDNTSGLVDNNSRVPCLNRNSSHVYVNVTLFSLTSYDVPKTCKVIATATAFYEEELGEKPSYETALKMQEFGFQMRWSVECRDCMAKGRGCVYKSADTFLFKCETEYDYYAELRLIYTILASWFLSVFIGFVRFILLPLGIWAFILHKYLSTRNKTDNREKSSEIQKPLALERFNYTDILSMSNNLKEKLGQGCFGTVYKGQLTGDCSIAFKKLDSFKVNEEYFIDGVSRLSGIQHPNLVPVLGFCSEGSKNVIVTQYMPNGSLDKYIFSDDDKNLGSFSWEKVWEIVFETGRGVEFLHGRPQGGIVHLDIKPRNILFDENFRPRISDFGLAKLCPKMHDLVSLYERSETSGYMAPELMISRDFKAVSCKSDVYSFRMIRNSMWKKECRCRCNQFEQSAFSYLGL